MRLLLDTCTFLWLVAGSKELSSDAKALFSDPANEVLLSSASVWEIVVKNRLGKLPLPDTAERFIIGNRKAHGIDPLPIDEESALQLSKLPDFHSDPFDRMLVCQAVVHALTILTPDEMVRRYPIRTMW
ncbi:MAG TPA: type II toxin-antitoxin system VapC family toxin [Burkholderiales bacterium]|nr:type II toxin-antitoxin system VapC family toxin [Burkholderiales bacterium]